MCEADLPFVAKFVGTQQMAKSVSNFVVFKTSQQQVPIEPQQKKPTTSFSQNLNIKAFLFSVFASVILARPTSKHSSSVWTRRGHGPRSRGSRRAHRSSMLYFFWGNTTLSLVFFNINTTNIFCIQRVFLRVARRSVGTK